MQLLSGRTPENSLSWGARADAVSVLMVCDILGGLYCALSARLGELLPGIGCHNLGSTHSKGVSKLCLPGCLKGSQL